MRDTIAFTTIRKMRSLADDRRAGAQSTHDYALTGKEAQDLGLNVKMGILGFLGGEAGVLGRVHGRFLPCRIKPQCAPATMGSRRCQPGRLHFGITSAV